MANKTASTLWFSIISTMQFTSMAFLIICCVTAPVFKQIGLSKYNNITYGVFGYCDTSADTCSKASASYDPYTLQNDSDNTNWKLSSKARDSLGKILIVTPIAAGLNFFSFLFSLFMVIMSFMSSELASASVIFILHLFVAGIGFLAATLICIVVFLLFYPNVTWCSWILIPAAALPLVSIPLIFFAHSYSTSPSYNDDSSIDGEDREIVRILDEDDMMKKQYGDISKGIDEPIEISPFSNPQNGSHVDSSSTIATSNVDEKIYKNNSNANTDELGNGLEKSETAYSAIDSQRLPVKQNSIHSHEKKIPSLSSTSSSSYSDKERFLANLVKESDNREIFGSNDNASDSGLTSVSQRGVNPYFQQAAMHHQPQQQPQQPQQPQQNFNNNRNQMQYPNSQMRNVNQSQPRYNNHQPQNMSYNQYNNGNAPMYNNQRNMQRAMPNNYHNQYQQMPQQNYYPQQQFQPRAKPQYNNNYPPQQMMPNGRQVTSNRYQPAYKKMQGRNNIPNASAMDNAYNFR
ncbi:hypothetical protein Kpol_295p2 [Vanderwaltozyma polyspora DSM 70294]|uniref:PH-response regulator protein palI/RIM9 n=1 Tax=Vanderwaltozyma polyspora (strain ATCC 22028 / DSM 70294 / BCRC 21397 / CBS 2163 / NBRC 10782 / NRRL Y-8283 / UCD 57-17) TaxID=436907 RepID=A7TT16_VANPO|nr:uncharacterized protein Kpol_295p2 [Vanderwaltozyma polyspora DSM 70294]EDO14586.1 hypothetical protein Kpol_295p2 [Vanderwaltozyma polyspora DSM 70294]